MAPTPRTPMMTPAIIPPGGPDEEEETVVEFGEPGGEVADVPGDPYI